MRERSDPAATRECFGCAKEFRNFGSHLLRNRTLYSGDTQCEVDPAAAIATPHERARP